MVVVVLFFGVCFGRSGFLSDEFFGLFLLFIKYIGRIWGFFKVVCFWLIYFVFGKDFVF